MHDQQQSLPLLEGHELTEYETEADNEIIEDREGQIELSDSSPRQRALEILSRSTVSLRRNIQEYVQDWRRPQFSDLWIILPRYLQPGGLKPKKKPHPTQFVDALRGYAACIVVAHHIDVLPETWILRQPPFFMLFNGPGMVDLFFVISGYVLTRRMIKFIRQRDHQGLLQALASSTFRRYLRLYGSSLLATFIIMVLGYLHLLPLGYVPRRATFWISFKEWVNDVLYFTNPFREIYGWFYHGVQKSRYIPVLWTIPVEFRGSMVVFAFCTMTCKLSSRTRSFLSALLIILFLFWEAMYAALFLVGARLAELGLQREEHEGQLKLVIPDSTYEKSSTTTTTATTTLAARLKRYARSYVLPIVYIVVFLVSVFLYSQPRQMNEQHWGWPFLWKFIPFWFTNGVPEAEHFYLSIAASLLLFALESFPPLRTPLNWNISQYLGDISFGIYVCHPAVIISIEYRYLAPFWKEHVGESMWAFFLMRIVTFCLIFWVADYFKRLDRRVVGVGRWLEGKLFIEDDETKILSESSSRAGVAITPTITITAPSMQRP